MDKLSPSGFYLGILKELGRNVMGLLAIFVGVWVSLVVGAIIFSCLIKWFGFLWFGTIGAIIIVAFLFLALW